MTTAENISDDALFAGRLHCRQHRVGYRFSVDAVLTAHFSPPAPGARILDLCSGCGVIGLICLYRWRQHIVSLAGLELQPQLAALSVSNGSLNGFSGVMQTVCGDLRAIRDYFPAESFTQVICNPPFYRKNSGRVSDDGESFLARHQVQCSLPEIVAAAAAVVKNRGKVIFIYPAKNMPSLFAALQQYRLVPRRMQSIHSYPGASARLILVEAIKNGGENMLVLPPFYIYQSRLGPYSEEMGRLYAPDWAKEPRRHRDAMKEEGK